jgi:hydroxymethylglutaryl-CoA synthase
MSGTNAHVALKGGDAQYDVAEQRRRLVQYQHSAFIWWDTPAAAAVPMPLIGVSTPALEAASETQWERSWPSTICSYMAQHRVGQSQKLATTGIVAIDYSAPNLCCSVADIEQLHNCPGRYTVGRGQQHIGFTNGNEDTVSMAMTVFEKLAERCELPLTQIGRLEVGTESQVDRAKSVKSFLMAFFQDDALHSVEGADTYNACYGGTNALFSTVNWVQSASWSGQYGVVVCSDPAVHPQPEALSGIGASGVGLMVGAEQVMMLEATRISFIQHSW